MTAPTIAGLPLLEADISLPRTGVWHADAQSSGDEPLSGAVTIIDEGVSFVGTVYRSGVNGGRVLSKVVGGKGKLATELDAKAYASGARVRSVIEDILRETGETLSPSSEDAVLAHFLGKWDRAKGKASAALGDVLAVKGATWRVLADGTVWVGAVAFPAQDVECVTVDEDWIGGTITIAPERPDLRPGVTFQGQPISYVVHQIRSGSLRTEARLVDAPGNLLERLLGPVYREIDYSRKYISRVVSQDAGGLLSVVTDDPKFKGKGIDKVVIRTGIPGKLKVPAGARVMVGWDGGDPDKPFAEGWDGTSYTEIQFGNGSLPVSRQGDPVTVAIGRNGLTDVLFKIASMLQVGPGTAVGSTVIVNPLLIPTLAAAPIMAPGSITHGNAKLRG